MKPCSNYRKRIAWLAVGVLDNREERKVRAHLPTCPGCRNYLEEMSRVSDKLSACRIDPHICASETFHQKLAHRLKAVETASRWAVVVAQLQAALPKWKMALPVIGAAAAVVTALLLVVRPPAGSSPRSSPIKSAAAMPPAKRDLPPTISNYQMIANHSLEKLDEVLTTEGNRNPPPAPVYTVSSFAHATLSD
jgi:anti-sigma factor RsiW